MRSNMKIYIWLDKKGPWGWIEENGNVYHDNNLIGKLVPNGNRLFAEGFLHFYAKSIDYKGNVYDDKGKIIAIVGKDDNIYDTKKNKIGTAFYFWDNFFWKLIKTQKTPPDPQGGGVIVVIVIILIIYAIYSKYNKPEPTPPKEYSEYYVDYHKAADSSNYERKESLYFGCDCYPGLYNSGDTYWDSVKYYQHFVGMNKGYDEIVFERCSVFFDEHLSYDENFDRCVNDIVSEKDAEIIEYKSCQESDDGRTYATIKATKGEYFSVIYYFVTEESGIYDMKITYHNPKTDEEWNDIVKYITNMYAGCSFFHGDFDYGKVENEEYE